MLMGYKVMRTDGDMAISGANSRLSFPLKKDHIVEMPEMGIYLGMTKDYVLITLYPISI